MTRSVLNFVIDLITALVMGAILATGLLIHFVLPPGSGSRRVLWGYGRHDWGDVHFWLAVAAIAILLLHVALHWHWVCAMFARTLSGRRQGPGGALGRNTAGLAVIAALTLFFVGFVKLAQRQTTESIPTAMQGRSGPLEERRAAHVDGEDEAGGPLVQGSMTLEEVAKTCGLTLDTVRTRLNIDANEPADERLGRLSKKYGFSMPDARDKLNAKVAVNNWLTWRPTCGT